MKAFLLLTLTVAAAAAQTIEVQSLFQPAPLSGIWKHHKGDDPRWADPGFDDSAWPGVRMPEGAVQPGDGFSWYRFRVRLPETMPKEPLALMVGGFGYGQAYEVFWNGKRAGVAGDPDGGARGLLLPVPQSFHLPRHADDAVIAIRLRTVALSATYRLDPVHRMSRIGTRDAISLSLKTWQGERLAEVLPLLLIAAFVSLSGVFFLLLPLWRRDEPEYFWFGLWLLGAAALRVLSSYPEAFGLERSFANGWGISLANTFVATGWVGLLRALFRSRITPLVVLAVAAEAVPYPASMTAVAFGGSLLRGEGFWILAVVMTLLLCFIYYELGWRTSCAPERLPAVHAAIIGYLGTLLVTYGGSLVWRGESFNGLASLARIVSLLLFAFAMAVLMNQRSARLLGDRTRLSREMESAAEVQSLLLTSLPAAGDLYRIEPVYLPASEVGGDFYQIMARADGSRLVLVGDVSGKGLKAAMQVSATIGMLRRKSSSSPGAILAGLNDGLAGYLGGGFVTCCCARFDADGKVTIANAGHPPPYCDGCEVEVEAGLPLGIAPGVQYAESVARGEQFTFVSDGVVEAENAKRELFGFDRTREISGKSAREIAEAAQAWGQNDDFTVVTVRRLG